MHTNIFIAFVCAFLLIASPVAAAPSINGSTGLINTPSADVLHEGQFSLGYYNLSDGGAGIVIFNMARNLEVGAAGFQYDHQDNKFLLSAKYAVVPETILSPGLSIGVEDALDKKGRTAFAAVSKTLPFGFRIHAGVGNGRIDGMFYALEKTVNPIGISGSRGFPTTTLMLEYDGQHTNYGARMAIAKGLKMDAGWKNNNFYIGVSLTR